MYSLMGDTILTQLLFRANLFFFQGCAIETVSAFEFFPYYLRHWAGFL